MDKTQALVEATKRWAGLGPWVEARPRGDETYIFIVGNHIFTGMRWHKRTMGVGGSWAKAFAAAGRKQEKMDIPIQRRPIRKMKDGKYKQIPIEFEPRIDED